MKPIKFPKYISYGTDIPISLDLHCIIDRQIWILVNNSTLPFRDTITFNIRFAPL